MRYVCAVVFVSGGGGIGFGAGFDAATVALPFDAAVPTTTVGGTYFVSCRLFRMLDLEIEGRVRLHWDWR